MKIDIDDWVVAWWKAFAEREGYVYQGKPTVKRIMTDIASGK